jgi:hypothetical protein
MDLLHVDRRRERRLGMHTQCREPLHCLRSPTQQVYEHRGIE